MAKGISRARIVAAALDLLDEQGIEAVTARALAERLGVRAPALYWHVGSKREILDEMGTEVYRRVARTMTAQPMDGDWQQGLATYARVLRCEYLAHRDGARTFSGTRLTDPEVLRAQEPWLRHWMASGLTLAEATAAAELVTAFVVGFVIAEQQRAQSGDDHLLSARDPAGAEVPLVAAAGRIMIADSDQRFEQQLEMVLTGVAATVSQPPRSAAAR